MPGLNDFSMTSLQEVWAFVCQSSVIVARKPLGQLEYLALTCPALRIKIINIHDGITREDLFT